MQDHLLAKTNWKTIQAKKIDLVVLPWGATEAHNYHLPYGTDVFEAEAIAAHAAQIATQKNASLIVLPAIPFGVNTGQADIKLDINLNPTTQLAIVADILETLNRQGIKKLLILNSHGGNDFKWILRELGLKYPKMFLSTCNWFQALNKKNFFAEDGDHADEMETSLMLYLKPELVLALDEAGNGAEKKLKIKEFGESWAWTERKWSRITADTGVGNPKSATAIKGEKYFKAITEKVANLMIEIANADLNNLYED
jgi:creatinine amidohydrolase